LLQWLLPDFPTENPLLNGMFLLYLLWLGVDATPLRASRKTLKKLFMAARHF